MAVPTLPGSARPRHHAPPGHPSRRTQRGRWTVISVLALAFASVLMVAAYANSELTPDSVHETDVQDNVPAEVLQGGPIINAAGGTPRSYRMPPKTIALTFDDGPDPWWTRKVLDVLRRHQARATFFVVGSEVARQPVLTRDIAANGHELGAHTFTHPDLTAVPSWRRHLEYAQTQLAIAKAAGVQTALLRFPYSSKAEAFDDRDWPVIREAGDLGYLVVVNDTDSQDWARPGVDAIVRNMTPPGDSGAIILLHDSGGDRSQTVAALDRFIPAMQARGYRFTTVTAGLNQTLADAAATTPPMRENPAASRLDRWRGAALLWAVEFADGTLRVLALIFVLVGVLALGRTLLLLVLAGRHARRRRARSWSWGPPVAEPVSVVVPAYNEKEGIAAAVRSLAGGDYPEIEVIVVDDGSTDGTADIAEELGLPNVRVVRKPNGGKATALNTGIALARHELIVMVDGDTIFEADSIRRLVQPFADPAVGAVAGNVKVGNQDTMIGRWQQIEYVIGFNLDRRLYETLQCMPTIPGAIGAFRRRALIDVGGVSGDTLAEDTDLTMALSRVGWKVVYEETARAWTEAPATLEQLWKQRYRWSYGTMQAMWKHRRALVEHGASGRFGRRCLPMLSLFGVLLPLLGPVIDLMAVYGLFFADWTKTLGAWLAMLALQFVTAVVAFRLDRGPMRSLWSLPLQQFAYRQLMYLVLIQSVVTAVSGVWLRWHKLQRTGETAVSGRPGRTAIARARAALTRDSGRDRYIDTLRAVALGRVIVYHMFGFAWLSVVFPAMGVMFALAGSLMARSLDRNSGGAVVVGRVRRLLPALWVFGAVLLAAMIWHDGWGQLPAWPRLLTWVVPVTSPPGTEWVADGTEVLWYLVTYLWLVLLSPAALWLYRRRPVATVLLPLAALAVLELASPLAEGPVQAVVTDVATFGACWVIGFAHRDGALRRMALPLLVGGAMLALGVGAAWAVTHRDEFGYDLNGLPLAQGFYSLGFVMLLLRARPSMAWLSRIRVLDRLVTLLNARAVTVYLWHNVAIALCFVVGDWFGVWRLGDVGYLPVALALLVVPLLLVGWVEDLGGRRRPRLLPWRPSVPAPAAPAEARSGARRALSGHSR
ncbi:Glycosyltransferase, catalytic subunit of cellulose synthase and poly-beta-1,6-N-acetylglucosamine synthase [Micromonospora pattaloongensis]|uniref:Glycosyltransferase, catalytic subunit of cellulose synthase and poly-beta-1,6-N-acetylglucosamine synthase n=1 Tax=Micromonospora pattaloongensis TaxID=405436 RepID=A0A1H3LW12_9ACTN|nr:Glycosyltransferase, catalytic subunit of cellulose synthase and poly-beta-1,6-N-acetylglucosamine synthase [Micromonospora pattaloongensis]